MKIRLQTVVKILSAIWEMMLAMDAHRNVVFAGKLVFFFFFFFAESVRADIGNIEAGSNRGIWRRTLLGLVPRHIFP